MKYLVLIYGNPLNWGDSVTEAYGKLTEEEHDQREAAFDTFYEELKVSGKLIAGTPLGPPQTTKTITQRNGHVAIMDGPFAEAKEQLAGVLLVDCNAIDEAYEIAKNFNEIKFGAIEIRPVAV
jgi:hypothetical protein